MATHTIDPTRCTGCGLCEMICGCWIYDRTDDGVTIDPDSEELCVRCGHCMAICPTKAVQIEGMDYADFPELSPSPATSEALEALLKRRRSTRVFREDPVPREVLERIAEAAATAPMGFPPSEVNLTVLSTREQVAKIVPASVKQFEELQQMTRNRLGRAAMRRMVGQRVYRMLTEHMLPFAGPGLALYHNDGTDFVTWGAPTLMLFHADPDHLMGDTNCLLAATHAMLMAEALGIGNIMLGVAASAVQYTLELKRALDIPPANEVFSALALGYAQCQFERGIRRPLKSVSWL
jgi:nitroreductase/NAD-dependent dihydropyrimidine dehydrogenase PreA subunit